jgi:muconate cycloisomerase
MSLTVNCPKCRAPMKVDEKHLGMKGRCSKCGEVFTMTAPSNGPWVTTPAAPPIHNPFANPFGAEPEPVEERREPEEASSGVFGFQFAAPPPPSPAAPPPIPAPNAPTISSPFEPFVAAPEPPRVEAPEYATTFEPISEPPSPAAPAFAPRIETPPVVLEVTPPVKAPFIEQKIATIETFVVKLAAKRTLRGPHGAIIREGKATTRLFVKVAGTSGDAVGWSECNPLLALQGATVESAAALVRRFLRPALEGAVLADVNGWLRRLERTSPADAGPSAIAKAAVEAACLDLLARTLEVPLHMVWGGAKAKSVPVAYAVDVEPARHVAEQIKRGRDRGATAFHLVLEGIEAKDRATLTALGKDLPEGPPFSVGFLRGHRREAALRLCSVAASVGASAVRGTLLAESPGEFERLAVRSEVPLLADVHTGGVAIVLELVRTGVGGVVLQPGLLGWRETWTAAMIAQAAGLRAWLSMQGEGALGLAAVAHLAAALGTDAPILDSGRTYAEAHFLPDPGNNGPIRLADEPGTGVAVDETLLRAAAVESG